MTVYMKLPSLHMSPEVSHSFMRAVPAPGGAGRSAEVGLQTGRSALSVYSAAQQELTLLEQNPSVKNTEKNSHSVKLFDVILLAKRNQAQD